MTAMQECFQTQQGHGPDEPTGTVTACTNLSKTEQLQILAPMEEKFMQSHPSLRIYWQLTAAGDTGVVLVRFAVPNRLSTLQ